MHTVGSNAPSQHVIRASQYAFTTDFALDQKDPLVVELVELREDIRESLRLPASDTLIRIVVFENQQRFDEFIRLNFPELPARRAFFLKQNGTELTVFACKGETLREDLRHEVTHALLNAALPEVPLWLDEGLAEYFEAHNEAGHVNATHLERLRRDHEAGWVPDLARLESMKSLWHMRAADYRESWLWVHYCLEHSPETRDAFFDYLAEVRLGQSTSLSSRLASLVPAAHDQVTLHLDSLETSVRHAVATPGDSL